MKGLHAIPSNVTDYFLDVADFLHQYATRNATPHRLSQYLATTPQISAEEVLAESKEMYLQGLSHSCVRFWFNITFNFIYVKCNSYQIQSL